MKIKLIEAETELNVRGKILSGDSFKLPTMHEGWRFNFKKHAQKKDCKTFVLVTEDKPDEIEGCLIYKMNRNAEPYMAFIEIAPHNKGETKKFDRVAGCLIAFACRLSFIHGKNEYKGWLAFDVQEETEEEQEKLMLVYSKKYLAQRIASTSMMVISPENGEKLILNYLTY